MKFGKCELLTSLIATNSSLFGQEYCKCRHFTKPKTDLLYPSAAVLTFCLSRVVFMNFSQPRPGRQTPINAHAAERQTWRGALKTKLVTRGQNHCDVDAHTTHKTLQALMQCSHLPRRDDAAPFYFFPFFCPQN